MTLSLGYVTGGPNGGPMVDWASFDNNFTVIYNGPETYRPSMNAYMVAGAQAISQVAPLAGNSSLSAEWSTKTCSLYLKMQNLLWNHDLQFWIDVVQGTNLQVIGRQLIGYFPFRYNIGTEHMFVRGLEAGLNSDGFLTEFGPTTLEQSSPYYTALKNTTYCCVRSILRSSSPVKLILLPTTDNT